MLKVKIIDPNQVVYEGEAEYVIAPGRRDNLGIMPGHTPMFAELVPGTIHLEGKEKKDFEIESGMLRVRGDVVTILIGL